jgi:PEP-CTERM motif
MRRYLLAVGFVVMLSGPSQAAPCLPGSLADYIALGAGGCSLGAATAADFSASVLALGAEAILPEDVTVTPIGRGFDFGFSQAAGASEIFDTLIRFSLNALNSSKNILSLSGASASGDGVVVAVGDTCAGGTFAGANPGAPCSGTAAAAIALRDAFGLISPDIATFPASSFFDVFVQLTIDGGLAGTAGLDGSVRTVFVPEPSTLLVMAAGLGAALARRRKRQ